MSDDPVGDLEPKVNEFASDLADLLTAVFCNAPPIIIERLGEKRVIKAEPAVPLCAQGEQLARLDISFRCRTNSSRKYLVVDKSTIKLIANIDKTPIIRWDYERDAHSKPSAHIQVHGHRGALSHLLSRTSHPSPHSMESLHLPVGGAHFRPCLEDIVEFLVRDCRMDAKPGWKDRVYAGRVRWRRIQAKTVALGAPEDAASALRELGYDVRPPSNGIPPDAEKTLNNW